MDKDFGANPSPDMEGRTIGVFITGLPNSVQKEAVDLLIGQLARLLAWDMEISLCLERCGLQPTERAAVLAATAAVSVLFAHEVGQEVAESKFMDMLTEDEKEALHAAES